ncbi:MAG: putative 2-hydroxyacid dehydrogenase [Phycisphaerales bacterium]|nr:putative 2-hydroxyacid dehydrogenase [Phycisphaerales bacterium]
MDLQQHKRAGEAVVVVTRSVPGEVAVTGATVRVMGDQKPSADELKAAIRGASVVVTMFSDRVDRAFLDAAGPSLKGICNFAVGFDNIDLAACRDRGVIVTNTPHAVTEGTADLAWTLILAVARRLIEADRFARSPEYPARGPLGISEFLGADLTGRNLLIVGAGRIGYATALRSIGWGMRVMYTARSRHVDFELAPLAGRRVTLEEGLREADVISIHTPLTPQTRHLIDARAIALMKPTAILVNTSRGPVVDEAALAAALQDRRIFGAGLDVFEDEPRVHPGLIGLTNCTLTPHIGSAEDKYRRLMTEMVCENAAAIIAGREPPNRIA